MSTLYPAMVNSPVTELSAAIDAAATTITVLNGNALPDAPNIATIGQGDTAETVQYSGKTGNTLSEVVRGFEGTARSWTSGTKIARNFTAYDYDTIRTKLDEGQTIPAPIVRGPNVINATQASGATFKVLGCTLCNWAGRGGNFETDSNSDGLADGWLASLKGATASLSTESVSYGLRAQRITSTAGDTNVSRDIYRTFADLDSTKYYVAIVNVVTDGSTTARLTVGAANIETTAASGVLHIKFTGATSAVVYLTNRKALGQVGWVQFDGFRLFEVTTAEYAAIGTTITGEAIDRRWPYVDSVQHLQGVSVRKTGRNLVPPFSQWTVHANAKVLEPYKMQLDATGEFQATIVSIPVVPNQTYTFTVKGQQAGCYYYGIEYDSAGAVITSVLFTTNGQSGDLVRPFTTKANAASISFRALNQGPPHNTGTFIFNQPQIEIGTTSSPFEARVDQYAHAPIKLASNVDRTIADSYDSATGQVFRRYVMDVKLDGALSWSLHDDQTTFKRIKVSNTGLGAPWVAGSGRMVKYNGSIIPNGSSSAGADIHSNPSDGILYLSVADADSGWTDTLNPNANAIKALMNGWKANGNNGTVYNSWVSILDGSAPPTNTEAYVAANKAPGWDAYATLDYVRATPITETLTGDLGALSMVKGGNAVELLEGVIVREKATVSYNPNGAGFYRINVTGHPSYTPNSPLSRRAASIMCVYRDNLPDDRWSFLADPYAYGSVVAQITAANYDPAAEYYVDYIVLDKYQYTTNAVDATLVYQSTLGGAVAQNTQDIARIKAQMGVHEWQLMLDEAYADNLRMDLDAATARATNNIRALSQGGMI
ncbi:hypothetical protein [Paenibacillus sp. PAMC21692]|uniref:hypothetical protein n=1 Tax=Paenibacillus sp. PAMC21692 TaxID=2762320 RepID=UPI00164E37C0|nr:hypothetical protein [Paenibacillus sp. PAMC21692]QNK54571.1 hypothetical protein H7F31_18090 [Paenibacillus sp. PAMC21692]